MVIFLFEISYKKQITKTETDDPKLVQALTEPSPKNTPAKVNPAPIIPDGINDSKTFIPIRRI